MTPRPVRAAPVGRRRAAPRDETRPLLKWAGGKRQLLGALRPFYPADFDRYIEPFAGSAAVFLDLHNLGRLERRRVRLADSNPDITGCYRAVRDSVDEVIAELEVLAEEHGRRDRALFHEVRDERFNPLRRRVLAGGVRRYPPALAAMLIYLNRTGDNGLYRLNSRGDFNVPAGRYASPRICDADNLRRGSRAFGRRGVSIVTGGFEAALADAGAGDVVYVDPPYAPVSATARFTAYTAGGFGPADQVRLRDVVVDLARRGCAVLVNNSTAPEIRALYVDHGPARAAGLRAFTVPVRRAINSRGTARGPVMESLITNLDPGPETRREAGERCKLWRTDTGSFAVLHTPSYGGH